MAQFWRLRPGWSVLDDGGGLRICSDTRTLSITSLGDSRVPLERMLEGAIDLQSISDPRMFGVVRALRDKGLLIDADLLEQDTYDSPLAQYFVHIGHDSTNWTQLATKRVAILGLGGLGAGVLQHLVGAGIKNFLFLDFDSVENRNLELQFVFRISDIGRSKALAACDYVRQRSLQAEIVPICTRIEAESDLEPVLQYSPDLTVVCMDDPPESSYDLCSRVMWQNRIAVIHGGVMVRSGFFGPLFDVEFSNAPPTSFPLRVKKNIVVPIEKLPLAFAPVNSIIAAFIAANALYYLSGITDLVAFSHRTFVDLDKNLFSRVAAANPI